MRAKWAILCLVGVVVLTVTPVVAGWMNVVLGLFILVAAAAAAIIASHTVRVRERTALVVCCTLHDAVRRVVTGPAVTVLIPFWEKEGSVIHITYHLEEVNVDNVLRLDQRPSIWRFTVHVGHQVEPECIPAPLLGKMLPYLTNDAAITGFVRQSTDYCLRTLIAKSNLTHLYNGAHGRLERHLERLLEDRLKKFGIGVKGVQLTVWPPAGLQDTLVEAEQQRIRIALQVEQLAALLNAVAGQPGEANSLAFLELARSLGHNGQALVTVDLHSALNGHNVQQEQLSGATQLPFFPELLQRAP
jgi:regulator of protease activity HflC (stomatin/prohibitin superfamily)